jgi:hypothetical protein
MILEIIIYMTLFNVFIFGILSFLHIASSIKEGVSFQDVIQENPLTYAISTAYGFAFNCFKQ